MMVPKSDGTDRIVIDYIPLNRVTPPVTFRPPNMMLMLQRASTGYFFSKIDLVDAYAQLALSTADWHLFSFWTPWGNHTFTRLSQGWSAAPAHWQHYISTLLRRFWHTCCFAYHDDIIIFTATKEEHFVKLRQVKRVLSDSGLAIHDKKSEYLRTSIKIVGLNLTHGRVSPVIPWDSIAQWKEPTNVSQLRRFLGTVNSFRDFLPSLSNFTADLDKLTGKAPWHWESNHRHCFQQIKSLLRRAISLSTHTPGVMQQLIVDASDKGIGVILKEHKSVIACISRRLTPTETSYSAKERELLAVHWGTERLFHFTHDATSIQVFTDHANLVTSLKGMSGRGRINRSLDWLSNFPIHWTHIAGKTNPADGPSRIYDDT